MITPSPTVIKLSEKQIEKTILEYLSLRGIFCWKQNSVGVFDSKRGIYRKPHSPYIISGICDILGILTNFTSSGRLGQLLAIEVKVPARRSNLTDAQANFIERVNKGGGLAFVATSVEDVKKRLVNLI